MMDEKCNGLLPKIPPPGGHPRVASLALRAIHLRVAPEGGRETAPSGACGEQPPKAALGERRNSGGNLQASTTQQTSNSVTTKTARLWKSLPFQNHYVTARIPHQSWHRLWRHHDSFPPGEAFGRKLATFLLLTRIPGKDPVGRRTLFRSFVRWKTRPELWINLWTMWTTHSNPCVQCG